MQINHSTLRQQLIDTALAMNSSEINQGTSGNISVRVDGGFLITPSALPYEECRPQDIVLMDLAGNREGKQQPSSEWRLHRDIYLHREEAGAILHAHPPWCTTLACLGREIPPFHYMIAITGGTTIRCAPYATFGTQELSDHALYALEARNTCLLANHGMLCLEENLQRTLSLAIEVENLARIYSQALQIGKPLLLEKKEMNRVLEKFKDYKRHPIS